MDRFTGRRKLLSGSLSVPVVLTVASPGALARQSFEACLYRASKAALPSDLKAVINGADHDTWLRKAVYAYPGQLQSPGPPGSVSVINFSKKTDDPYWYEIVGADGKPRYYPVTVANGQCPNPAGYEPKQNSEPIVTARKSVQVLVFVNEDGTIAGFGTCPTQGGFAVTTSCFASFGGMMQL